MHNKPLSIIVLKRSRPIALYKKHARVWRDNVVVDLDLHDLQRAWMVEDLRVGVLMLVLGHL